MNYFSFSGALNFFVSFFLGFFVFFKNPSKLVNKTYFLYSLSIAFWSFGYWQWLTATEKISALFWIKFLTSGSIFIPITYFHFILSFTNQASDYKNKRILYFGYVISIIFLFINFTPLLVENAVSKLTFQYWPVPGSLYSLFLVMFFSYVIYSIILMSISLKKITGYKQNQVKYILIGSILGFTGGATNFPLWYDIPIYPYGNFAVLIFFVTFTYAIVRFRLMDIKFVFKKGMVYSLSAGLLTALFVVIVISMTNFLSNVAGIGSFSITLIAALIIAVLFNPLKNKIQLFIDRSFYKNAYNYYPTVRKISRKLTSFFDIDQLFEYIGEVIFSTLNLKSILLLKDIPYRGFESVYHKSQKTMNANINIPSTTELLNIKIQKSSELVKFFKTSDDILIKDELPAFEKIIGIDKINLIDNELTGFQGEVVVPVFIENKLTVLIILGEKLSGDMFTLEDINLLSTISDQTAIALKNVTLYKDKVNSERLASIGMMSATFAHEIRNPLTSLKTFAQLMPEKYNDEEFRNTFSKIVEGEIERIDGLIGDLLDFSTEKKASRMNIINVVSLVDETVDYVKSQLNIDKKGISVSKMYSEDEIFISGDSEKLKQTFINILMNGCQAMNGEGILTVKIRQNAKVLNVYISDTGKGIHPDHIEKIFDPFVTTKEMGVGLGLAISKRIIEDHNGKISVKSSISKGSTFKISLPVQN